MTRPDHVERLGPGVRGRAWPATRLEKLDTIVNLQGDLPTLDPASVRACLAALAEGDADIGTIAAEIVSTEERTDPNVVKVVGSPLGGEYLARALFHAGDRASTARGRSTTISASTPIPAPRLQRFVSLPPSPLELREKLEQLRALEAGMRINVGLVDTVPLGVDTPRDLERARQLLQSRH